MYIKYELNRAKNGEVFNREMIEWVLETDRDLVELDDINSFELCGSISILFSSDFILVLA